MDVILLNFHVFQIFLLYVCLYLKDNLVRYRILWTFVLPFFKISLEKSEARLTTPFPSTPHMTIFSPIEAHGIIYLNLNFIRLFLY